MIKLFVFLFILLLCNCSVPFYNSYFFDLKTHKSIVYAKKINIDLFREWGLFRITGEKLHILKGMDKDLNVIVANEKFCPNDVDKHRTYLGAKIYENKKNPGYVNVDCLYELSDVNKMISRVFEETFSRTEMLVLHVQTNKDDYSIYLNNIEPLLNKEKYRLRKVKQNIYTMCNVENNCSAYKGPVYELNYKINDSIYSISFKTDFQKMKGYKPIIMDYKQFPLESPKYKALRKREEVLNNRFKSK